MSRCRLVVLALFVAAVPPLGAQQYTPDTTRKVFVVHGDPDATDMLRFRIGQELGWAASVPPHASTRQA